MKKRFSKKEIYTIPNAMSLFRLCLIPFIVYLYWRQKEYAAVGLIVLSGATDIADGIVARRFHMVSDFGKILDPIADKLTQGAMLLCLLPRYPLMLLLVVIFCVKECVMALLGCAAIRCADMVNSAKWYGKVCTVVLDLSIAILILFPSLQPAVGNGLIFLCAIVMLTALVLYARFYLRLLAQTARWEAHRDIRMRLFRIAVTLLWISVGIFCIVRRDLFTADGVVRYTGGNPLLVIGCMLLLFALKSTSIFIYCGVLYAASGILYSLPVAIAVNLLGTVVMVSIPWWLGRRTGAEAVERFGARHPKLASVQRFRQQGPFLFALLTRSIKILPSDALSFYLGSVHTPYPWYLLASVIGLLPSAVTFPIMGGSIADPLSVPFLTAAAVELAITGISFAGYLFLRKKRQNGEKLPKD